MKNNMENPKINGSAPAGSPNVPAPNPNMGAPAGQTNMPGGADASKNYDELLKRFGSQGQELGEFKTFFGNIQPLLGKLDQAPGLVQAILDGKVDDEIAKAIMENRVDVRDAAIVQQAANTVKENMGAKAFDMATPEAITKLVQSEVLKVRKEFEEKADLQTFQDYTQKFIEKTPDFQEHAEEIDKWLDTHDVSDIEVAYYAVKGKLSEGAAKKAAEVAQGERAKEMISNASGGGQSSQYAAPDGTPLADKYISGQVNPNSFFNK